MEWVVVEFPSEKTVEVIPNKWVINENSVYWPDEKPEKLKTLIAKCVKLSKEWCKCRARILGKGKIYDILQEARIALSKSEYTSDLENSNNKREIKKPTRFLQNSPTSSELTSGDEDANFFDEVSGFPTEDLGADSQDISMISMDATVIQSKPQEINMISGETTVIQNKRQEISKISSNTTVIQNKPENNAPNNNNCSCKDILMELIKEVKMMNQKLNIVLQDLSKVNKTGETNETTELLYNFPINNYEDMEHFEKMLKEQKDFKRKMVEYIYLKGGNNEYDYVKRNLTLIMGNKLQSEYNWLGQKGKKSFKSLELATVIKEGIFRNKTLKSTELGVEKAVKNFLRHASDRVKAEENTVKKIEE